jgi:hypothetical protein
MSGEIESLNAIIRSLGIVEGKIDTFTRDLTMLQTALAVYDKRIGVLENKASFAWGAASAFSLIGAAIGYLVNYLVNHTGGHS